MTHLWKIIYAEWSGVHSSWATKHPAGTSSSDHPSCNLFARNTPMKYLMFISLNTGHLANTSSRESVCNLLKKSFNVQLTLSSDHLMYTLIFISRIKYSDVYICASSDHLTHVNPPKLTCNLCAKNALTFTVPIAEQSGVYFNFFLPS